MRDALFCKDSFAAARVLLVWTALVDVNLKLTIIRTDWNRHTANNANAENVCWNQPDIVGLRDFEFQSLSRETDASCTTDLNCRSANRIPPISSE
mmetsp:Transcript_949/g.2402  ORF Transcript_949/g.2402 Transcript_949/m.2402 type:complete len:95 (+) Transcript_949:85-369(+)